MRSRKHVARSATVLGPGDRRVCPSAGRSLPIPSSATAETKDFRASFLFAFGLQPSSSSSPFSSGRRGKDLCKAPVPLESRMPIVLGTIEPQGSADTEPTGFAPRDTSLSTVPAASTAQGTALAALRETPRAKPKKAEDDARVMQGHSSSSSERIGIFNANDSGGSSQRSGIFNAIDSGASSASDEQALASASRMEPGYAEEVGMQGGRGWERKVGPQKRAGAGKGAGPRSLPRRATELITSIRQFARSPISCATGTGADAAPMSGTQSIVDPWALGREEKGDGEEPPSTWGLHDTSDGGMPGAQAKHLHEEGRRALLGGGEEGGSWMGQKYAVLGTGEAAGLVHAGHIADREQALLMLGGGAREVGADGIKIPMLWNQEATSPVKGSFPHFSSGSHAEGSNGRSAEPEDDNNVRGIETPAVAAPRELLTVAEALLCAAAHKALIDSLRGVMLAAPGEHQASWSQLGMASKEAPKSGESLGLGHHTAGVPGAWEWDGREHAAYIPSAQSLESHTWPPLASVGQEGVDPCAHSGAWTNPFLAPPCACQCVQQRAAPAVFAGPPGTQQWTSPYGSEFFDGMAAAHCASTWEQATSVEWGGAAAQGLWHTAPAAGMQRTWGQEPGLGYAQPQAGIQDGHVDVKELGVSAEEWDTAPRENYLQEQGYPTQAERETGNTLQRPGASRVFRSTSMITQDSVFSSLLGNEAQMRYSYSPESATPAGQLFRDGSMAVAQACQVFSLSAWGRGQRSSQGSVTPERRRRCSAGVGQRQEVSGKSGGWGERLEPQGRGSPGKDQEGSAGSAEVDQWPSSDHKAEGATDAPGSTVGEKISVQEKISFFETQSCLRAGHKENRQGVQGSPLRRAKKKHVPNDNPRAVSGEATTQWEARLEVRNTSCQGSSDGENQPQETCVLFPKKTVHSEFARERQLQARRETQSRLQSIWHKDCGEV